MGSDELMSATLAMNTKTPSSLVKEMESVLEPEGKMMQSSRVKSGVVELSTLTIPEKNTLQTILNKTQNDQPFTCFAVLQSNVEAKISSEPNGRKVKCKQSSFFYAQLWTSVYKVGTI